jgi:hypothetical protein
MKFRKRKANVVNVNNRKESHGEENVLAIDVKVKVSGTPKLLDDFDTALWGAGDGRARRYMTLMRHEERERS